jgi:Glycosyltransferases, probably involved in cell wall biogenesis
MAPVIWTAAIILCITVGSHLATVAVASIRCRARTHVEPAPHEAPPISLVRPLCGLDNFVEPTLRSGFELDYPSYELIFCVAHARDPVVPTVQRLIDEHPHVRARLLIGDERISANPKLNNCFKGWNAAAHEWIRARRPQRADAPRLSDAAVELLARGYRSRLLAAVGNRAAGILGRRRMRVPQHLRGPLAIRRRHARGRFAQGKTMFWRRSVLEDAGGIRLLGLEPAEDAASTKVVRDAGLRVRLVDAPFPQPLGRRTALEVWRRQARWAQLRRASFPCFYVPEIIGGALLPSIAAATLATALDLSWIPAVLAVTILWYGTEMKLARVAGWPLSRLYPLHALVRDLALPALWVSGWRGSPFVWRGNAVSSVAASESPQV